ncbi:DUF6838 family protein [Caproicibacterium sp. XB1]|uniref:phage tail terminator family protein n=1 Tax=Caproicibacterium sp. XB1 TaxID=3396405 RepID=UPI0039B6F3E2
MINDIISAIAAVASAEKAVPVYDSEAEQDFNPPCFFVQSLELNTAPQIMAQEARTQPFDIQYFPEESEGRNSLYTLAEQLAESLQVLTLQDGTKMRGTKLRWQIQDNVLHLFANYDVLLRRTENAEKMQSLTQKQQTKE